MKPSNKKHIIKKAPPEKEFFLCDGRRLKDIKELAVCFIDLKPEVFRHHVNPENKKNDFAFWIFEVLDDHELAQRLDEVHDQKYYTKLIKERVKELANFR